jgi:hypothetical protein
MVDTEMTITPAELAEAAAAIDALAVRFKGIVALAGKGKELAGVLGAIKEQRARHADLLAKNDALAAVVSRADAAQIRLDRILEDSKTARALRGGELSAMAGIPERSRKRLGRERYRHRQLSGRADGKTIAIAPRVDSQCCSVWRCRGYVSVELLPDRLADQKSGLSACGIGWRF